MPGAPNAHERRASEGTACAAPESRVVIQLVLGLVLAGGIALAASRLKLLTPDGALAALVVGTIIFVAGGFPLSLILVLAFATSSLLTRYRGGEKGQPEHRLGRSASQVLANGSVLAVLAVGHDLLNRPWILSAAVGALAASTADTWATELGLLSPRPPRLITTGAVVERGRSGGITLLGTLSGLAGALFVTLLGRIFLDSFASPGMLAGIIGGTSGLFADSILGATLQAAYICPECGRWGETATCTCGQMRRRIRGLRWMTNDTVNLLTTMVGAAVATLLAM